MLPLLMKSASSYYEWGMTVLHEAMSMGGNELVLLC